MELVNKYQYYSFQQANIPREFYDGAMEELAEMFQEALKGNLRRPYPYARGYFRTIRQTGVRNLTKKTGNLYNSVNVSFDPNTNQIKVKMLNYWKYVNDGRKPGSYVPLKPLMDWIKIKGLNRDPRGRFKAGSIKGLAAKISKSIQKKGIEPTNFYDDAFDLFVENFSAPDGPLQALGLDLQTFITKILQEPVE